MRIGNAFDAEPVLAVNERALGTDQDKRFVIVVDAANKAAYREVRLGQSVDGRRIVLSGLKPNERVIVDGLQRARVGAKVNPHPAAAPAGAKSGDKT